MRQGFRTQPKKKLMAEINVVPYIDVTLILLIIFMITAPIVQQAVTVDLPQTPRIKTEKATKVKPIEPFVISVTAEGFYKTSQAPDVVLGQKDLGNLVAEVVARSQLKPQQPFYIQGDRQAPYGKVVNLFVLLKANGVAKVSLMTEPEEKN
ncbi:biopolymer transporter ExbD [Hydrogenovibrio sp. SC-1]|uniref:ExbD/TolR family protein n=1 Tax=Hydrogenovibrio sp. SC-1 TaxID=2065820 RepID=UPI000C7C48DF|nr:ExbD/TolR family protein [Hydrogenovibrio sp. SC-1]PLA74754.1 biopolymer transporter ExbD [Hydrogenovibrio sp. SC-1]